MSHQSTASQEEGEEVSTALREKSYRRGKQKKVPPQSCWRVGEEESTSSIRLELLVFPWKHSQRRSFRCVCLNLAAERHVSVNSC